MDRLIAMQTFALVAELASFSKAAEALQAIETELAGLAA